MDAKAKALMDKQIRSELNSLKGELKKELLGGMPKMDNLKVVSLESKKLVSRTTTTRKSHSTPNNNQLITHNKECEAPSVPHSSFSTNKTPSQMPDIEII